MIDRSQRSSVDVNEPSNARQQGPSLSDAQSVGLLLEGLLRVERATERLSNRIADYLAPFRAGFVRQATTTSGVYAAAHPDEGFADPDSYVTPVLTRRVDVTVFGPANLVVQWDDTGANWEGGAEFPVGRTELWISARRVRVKSADATGAQQSRYSVVFWC